jgi:hypothetical protein
MSTGSWLASTAAGPTGIKTELDARCQNPTLGAEQITGADPTFASATGWNTFNNAGVSVSGGVLNLVNAGNTAGVATTLTAIPTASQIYRIAISIPSLSQGSVRIMIGGSAIDFPMAGTYAVNFTAGSGLNTTFQVIGVGTTTAIVDWVSMKPITAFNTKSGNYYQSATDGKFYRLYGNLWSDSEASTPNSWLGGLATASTFSGLTSGTGIAFGYNGSTNATLTRVDYSLTAGLTYRMSCYVRMDDGGAPVFANASTTSSANDFALIISNGAQESPLNWNIQNLGGGLYRVSAKGTANAASGVNGVYKYSTNSNRTFKVSGLMIEVISPTDSNVPSDYELKPVGVYGQSEVFRGSQSRPPRVWGIVNETFNITIYALDQPGCPMWMRFTNGTNTAMGWALATSSTFTVAALAGKLVWGSNTHGILADFAKDSFKVIYGSSLYGYSFLNNNIASRQNIGGVYGGNGSGIDTFGIINGSINSVSMCVMADAPTDPATDLPVPTIAVGTQAGVSIIQNNGIVSNSTDAFPVGQVSINPYVLWTARAGSPAVYYYLQPGKASSPFTHTLINSATAPDFSQGGATIGIKIGGRGRVGRLAAPGYSPLFDQLTLHEGSFASSLATQIAPTYNTGWMVGDIRRCYLTETDQRVLNKTELMKETGPFTYVPFNNSDPDYTLSIVNGNLRITRVAANGGGNVFILDSLIAPIPGQAYVIEITMTASSTNQAFVGASNGGASSLVSNTYILPGSTNTLRWQVFPDGSGIGKARFVFSPARSASYANSIVGDYMDILHISMRPAVADRTYKTTLGFSNIVGLKAFGALSRLPVGNNSQLTGYSGFNSTNYLQESVYSSDLDFGTGSLSATAWLNLPTTLSTTAATVAMFPVLGPELVTNGNFTTTSTTGWTYSGDGSMSVVNGALTFNQVTAAFSRVYYTFNVTAGKTYRATVKVTQSFNGGSVYIHNGNTGTPSVTIGPLAMSNPTAGTTYSCIFQSTFTTLYLVALLPSTPGASGGITSVSIEECGPCWAVDRSGPNGAYLRLGCDGAGRLLGELYDGTTTQRVTTTNTYNTGQYVKCRMEYVPNGASSTLTLKLNGAQVAQTTFAALQSLNRYNMFQADTEDVRTWNSTSQMATPLDSQTVVGNATAGAFRYVSMFPSTTDNPQVGVQYEMSVEAKAGTYPVLQIYGSAAAIGSNSSINFNLATGTIGSINGASMSNARMTSLGGGWYRCSVQFTINVVGATPVFSMQDTDTAINAAGSSANGTMQLRKAMLARVTPYAGVTYQHVGGAYENCPVLTIGNRYTLDAAWPGSLSMVRISGTVPTAEQSAFMYMQEAEMFQDGAQITLPDNKSLIDLDYDPVQDKWKVTSQSSESTFVGLIRTTFNPVAVGGTLSKTAHRSGIRLVGRSGVASGADVTIPAQGIRDEMVNRSEAAGRLTKLTKTFDFDATTGQTDFVLPLGWEALEVVSAGVGKREGSTKDWIRIFDGFRETVRFNVAPGASTWVQIVARQIGSVI